MKPVALAAAIALALVAGAPGQQPSTISERDPEKLIDEIEALRERLRREARDRNQPIDDAALSAAVEARAAGALDGVEPSKVAPARAGRWAELFLLVGRFEDAIVAARRYLATEPEPAATFTTRLLLVDLFGRLEEPNGIRDAVRAITPATAEESQRLVDLAVEKTAPAVAAVSGPADAAALLAAVESRIPFARFTGESVRPKADRMLVTLVAAQATYLWGAGRGQAALRALDDARRRLLTPESLSLRLIDRARASLTLTGSRAPALEPGRSYGDFKELPALEGKVVVLDFFAHWCMPCIASFPSLKRLHRELGAKGLVIVGVTSYFGFYGKEEDLDEASEFARMEGFVSEHELAWPVAFVERRTFDRYGVSALPRVVLIDRNGVVRASVSGFGEEAHETIRSKVEEILEDAPRKSPVSAPDDRSLSPPPTLLDTLL